MAICLALALTTLVAVSGASRAADNCGSLENSFGPFDYRTAPEPQRKVVEDYHFNADVETLKAGMTSAYIGHDIDYTLRVFPNHVRALWAMARLAAREKVDQPKGARYTIDCYFDRAIRFRPGDAQVRVVYGLHLVSAQNRTAAVAQLERAIELDSEDATVQYNAGLAFFDLQDFDRALSQAHRAYRLGFPLPGLRDKLRRIGKWQDPAAGKATSGQADSGR
jgi:tetratricopeptide (TPR) repeat protein